LRSTRRPSKPPGGDRSGRRVKLSKAGEYLFQEAKTLECEAGFAGFTGGNLALKIGLELRKRSIELVGSPRDLACFPDAFDRLLEDVDDGDHC